MAALYLAYFTGTAGMSMALFYIGKGIIAGGDAGGMHYDGSYQTTHDGCLVGSIDFVISPGQQVITGTAAGIEAARFTTPIKLPSDFDNGQTIRLDTVVGPINARFEKLKELPNG